MCLSQEHKEVTHQCLKNVLYCTFLELDDNKGSMKHTVDSSIILLKFSYFLVYVYITLSIAEQLPYSIMLLRRAQ